MNNAMRLITAGVMISGVAACSGEVRLPDLRDEGQIIEDLSDELHDSYQNAQMTPADAMPRTGSASYSGAAYFVEGSVDQVDETDRSNAVMVSTVDLTVDFARSDVTGGFSDFESLDPEVGDIGGALEVSDGRITASVFDADIDGHLSTEQGGLINVGGIIVGAFMNQDAGVISGLVDFDMTAVNTGETASMGGSYIAVQRP